MLVSIVIPTFDRPGYLRTCLQSLREQVKDDSDTEIIAVDDGSDEKNACENQRICAEFNCQYLHQGRNRGMAVARNAGIAKSSGEWVVFLDDDVQVNENWFDNLITLLKEVPCSVPGIEGKVTGSGGGVWDREVQNLSGGVFLTCHLIVRRSVLDRLSGFDPEFEFLGPFCEDHELAARVLMWGEIVFSDKISVTHLPRKVNLFRHIKLAPQRISGLLKAEFYFYRKHPDRYHLFRRAPSFWGTYLSILCRNIINDLRRRQLNVLLRHPIETTCLIKSSLFEQFTALLLAPRFLSEWISRGTGIVNNRIDIKRTACFWGINSLNIEDMRLPSSPVRSLFFKLRRKPVYDSRIVLSRISRKSPSVKTGIFLRIDDIFLDNKDPVYRLCDLMSNTNTPFLAAVTGSDLSDRKNASLLQLLRKSGAAIGLHGFSHQGRFGPFKSELLQINFPEFTSRLMKINESGVETPWILVPPYNAIGPEQIVQLSKHFKVICGGPETARFTERIIGPIAISGTWYFPSFHPFCGSARSILKSGVLTNQLRGLVCLTLHIQEEAKDDFRNLEKLLKLLPHKPITWELFRTSPEAEL